MLVVAALAAGCSSNTVPILPQVTSTLMTSSSGRTYQVSVALPDGYANTHAPYPVLYAADANGQYGTVVETARNLSFSQQIPDLVIVGIGYANPGYSYKASGNPRSFDMTPTADAAWVRDFANESIAQGVPPPEKSGGAPEFLGFLRSQLIPRIEQTYNVSHDDRGWYGHSFGGLLGTYLLLNANDVFKRFVIGSPSLWWDHRVMFDMEKSFAKKSKALPARAFFSVGGLEQDLAPKYPMVSDLKAFVEVLGQRHYQGFTFTTQVFEDENHLSVVPATISRGLRFVYDERQGAR